MEQQFGPKLAISEALHREKYRGKGESFYAAMSRIAGVLADDEPHRKRIKEILLHQRFLPAGRVQSAIGSLNMVTAFNCFVSGTIEDSMRGIMECFTESALTMRQGGGIGYDFSPIRPRGETITTLSSPASGPVSFMHIGDAVCGTVSSAGNRRGAQMAVLRIDHPDIEEFVTCKANQTALTRYNISVGVTDKFMSCMESGAPFPLMWEGRKVKEIDAGALWDLIMRGTWDWAEPGVLFIDRINEMNNLHYAEYISATNPCGEQPLPPYGACLLGSFNLVKYLEKGFGPYEFNWEGFVADIRDVIRMMDNVIDNTSYPLPEQEEEAKNKRRMGIGITGVANAIEALGYPYGTPAYITLQSSILEILRNVAYSESAKLAEEKGAFPLFDCAEYLAGGFIKTLPPEIKAEIVKHGIRNSHLLSIAPTGTISLTADNISSGIEPVFCHEYDRTIQAADGPIIETVTDYGFRELGIKGKTSDEVSVEEHLQVLLSAQKYVDSAVSKTCNVREDVSWRDFKSIYLNAFKGGAKGITTFRAAGKRYGILNKKKDTEASGEACFVDPATGNKECG